MLQTNIAKNIQLTGLVAHLWQTSCHANVSYAVVGIHHSSSAAPAAAGRPTRRIRPVHLPALTITPGITLVRGDEGVGKTTPLRLLAGERPQQVTQAQLAGHDLRAAPMPTAPRSPWLDPSRAAWDCMVVNDLWAQQARNFRRWVPTPWRTWSTRVGPASAPPQAS